MRGNSTVGGPGRRRAGRGVWYPDPRRVALLVLAALLSAGASAAEPWTVGLAELERPRVIGDWLSEPGLRPLMAAMAEADEDRLVIRHPGGDRGSLRARWLRGQLVALGLPRARIELSPGGVAAEELRVEMRGGDERTR